MTKISIKNKKSTKTSYVSNNLNNIFNNNAVKLISL